MHSLVLIAVLYVQNPAPNGVYATEAMIPEIRTVQSRAGCVLSDMVDQVEKSADEHLSVNTRHKQCGIHAELLSDVRHGSKRHLLSGASCVAVAENYSHEKKS